MRLVHMLAGNYDYSAWCPNRPSMIRKAIPRKDEIDKVLLCSSLLPNHQVYATRLIDEM